MCKECHAATEFFLEPITNQWWFPSEDDDHGENQRIQTEPPKAPKKRKEKGTKGAKEPKAWHMLKVDKLNNENTDNNNKYMYVYIYIYVKLQ